MRSHRSALVPGVTLAIALLATTPARAADADTERARALFHEAGELERIGRWGDAQNRLRAALRLRETPQLHYALGWALENDDKLLEARAAYETAARLGREHPSGAEAARLAAERLADVESKTPVIKVRVSGAARAQARVLVDGREVKREDNVATIAVNPGAHVIRVERGADDPVEQIAYVGRGALRTVDVTATADVAVRDSAQDRHGQAPSGSTASANRPHGDNVLPWLMVSGGVAFVAGGGALLLSGSAKDEARQAFGLTLGGVGLVAGVVGAVLLLRDEEPSGTDRPRGSATDRPHGRAIASAGPVPGGAIATAAFTF
ncbi:MAG: hypothetical protein KF894_10170 [Labilithrix sp.]|nr:hypothetical protein [Labilithrix sp.]